jgi:thioesterase domain-containing protein
MRESLDQLDFIGLGGGVPTSSDLEAFLHRNIPVSLAFGVRVICADAASVRLRAPLEPNVNARGTAFAGSIASIALLSGWIWLVLELRRRAIYCRPVVRRHSIDYLSPLSGALDAVCSGPTQSTLVTFHQRLIERGRASILLQTSVFDSDSNLAASSSGEYVALGIEQHK